MNKKEDKMISKMCLPITVGIRFFISEVAFAVLPIFIAAFIAIVLGNFSLKEFMLNPAWSFATIVLLGSAITHFIELKVLLQRDKSYRIIAGTQLAILSLIISVICLAFVHLCQQGVAISKGPLVHTQFILFFFALSFLAMSMYAKEEITYIRNHLPDSMRKSAYYKYITNSFHDIQSQLIYLEYALNKRKTIDLYVIDNYYNSPAYNKKLKQDLDVKIKEIEISLVAVKELVKEDSLEN